MANFLTVLRVILAFITLGLLFCTAPGFQVKAAHQPAFYMSAFFLTIFVIALDGLDGYVARMRNESSKLGSVLDILGDRIVENAYWVVFAVLGWVGVWVPLVVLSRGIITDGLRSIALADGYTAFGETSMIKNKIGNFITASRFSRGAYGGAKALAFVLMIAANIPNLEYYNPMTVEHWAVFVYKIQPVLDIVAPALVYIAVIFCVLRGIPVIVESKRFFTKNEQQ